jgi:hypothetical protein
VIPKKKFERGGNKCRLEEKVQVGCDCRLEAEHLPSMYEALNLILSTEKLKKKLNI